MRAEVMFWLAVALVAVAGVAAVKLIGESEAVAAKWPGLTVLANYV